MNTTTQIDLRPTLRETWKGRREALGLKKGSAKETDAFLNFLSGALTTAQAITAPDSAEVRHLSMLLYLAQVRGSSVLDFGEKAAA